MAPRNDKKNRKGKGAVTASFRGGRGDGGTDELASALRHHRAGRLREAEKGYRTVLQHFPDEVDVQCNLGAALYGQERLVEAKAVLRRAIACNPGHASAHFNLGNTLKGLGRIDEAVESYLRTVSLNPRHGAAHFNLGNVLFEQGELDHAAEHYRAVLAVKPNHAGALLNLGNVLKKRGNLDESLDIQEKLLAIDPENAAAHYNRGIICKALKRIDEALASFRRAADIDPGNGMIFTNMAHILKDQGRSDEARACFRRVLEIDPENVSAQHFMAALAGDTTERAPKAYVKSLYDGYAHEFDHLLVEKLGYAIPSILRNIFDGLIEREKRFGNALDLGCGTGLAGAAFRSLCDRLTGVDISTEMVAKAREKDLYDCLNVADLVEFLSEREERYHLFLATDVFIYTGNLEPVFSLVSRRSHEGAYFAFSTERCSVNPFLLGQEGRYAHSVDYIGNLAADHDFAVDLCRPAVIRKERNVSVEGNIFVLRYGSSRGDDGAVSS